MEDVGHLEEAEEGLREEATIVEVTNAVVTLHEVVIEVATEGELGATRLIKSCEAVKHWVY